MDLMTLALCVCLVAQTTSEPDEFGPIRLPNGEGAPPAELQNAPPDTDTPGEQPQARDVPPIAAPVDRPAETAKIEESPPTAMEALGDQPRQRLRPPELIAFTLVRSPFAGSMETAVTEPEVPGPVKFDISFPAYRNFLLGWIYSDDGLGSPVRIFPGVRVPSFGSMTKLWMPLPLSVYAPT